MNFLPSIPKDSGDKIKKNENRDLGILNKKNADYETFNELNTNWNTENHSKSND